MKKFCLYAVAVVLIPVQANAAPAFQCDGATDISPQLNQAINSLPSGGSVLLPRGKVCALRSRVNVKRSGIKLRGASTTFLRLGESSGLMVTGNNNSFSGFTIDGAKACNIPEKACKGSGIAVLGSGNQFDNVAAINNQGHGIMFDGQRSRCSHNVLRSSRFSNNRLIGISQHTCTYNRILNNRSTGNGAEGITADHKSDHATISGNILSGNVTRGGVGAIGIDYVDGVTVTGNRIGPNVKAVPAIRTQNNEGPSRNLRIEGNVADANPAGCIDLKTGRGGPTSKSQILNNRCSGSRITLGSGSQGNIVKGNDGPTLHMDTGPAKRH